LIAYLRFFALGGTVLAGFFGASPGGGGGSETTGGRRWTVCPRSSTRMTALCAVCVLENATTFVSTKPDHARSKELHFAKGFARLGSEEDDRDASRHASLGDIRRALAERDEKEGVRDVDDRHSRFVPDFQLLEQALWLLDEPGPALGHGRAELEAGFLVLGPDDERAAVDRDVLHPVERDGEREISPESERFSFEQRLAGGCLPPNADRALGFKAH
jgi:hypothetical protein